MAKMVTLVDDTDPTGKTIADRTVSFGFGKVWYDIDLSEENALQLEAELSFWISHGRKQGTAPKHFTGVTRPSPKPESEPEVVDEGDEWWHTPENASKAEAARYQKIRQDVREWGLKNGWPSLGERGRLPRALYAKWRARHQAIQQPSTAESTQADMPLFSDTDEKPKKRAHAVSKAAS